MGEGAGDGSDVDRDGRRGAGETGAAVLEFALIAVLLFTLVFGIIGFGLVLSFKQDMTRAAAEGARAAAVALPSTTTGAGDSRRLAAVQATNEAVGELNRTCNSGDGMTCVVQIHDCDVTPARTDLSPVPDPDYAGNDEPDCVTVRLEYDHDGHPLLAPLPMIEPFLPDTLRASSVVRLNE